MLSLNYSWEISPRNHVTIPQFKMTRGRGNIYVWQKSHWLPRHDERVLIGADGRWRSDWPELFACARELIDSRRARTSGTELIKYQEWVARPAGSWTLGVGFPIKGRWRIQSPRNQCGCLDQSTYKVVSSRLRVCPPSLILSMLWLAPPFLPTREHSYHVDY